MDAGDPSENVEMVVSESTSENSSRQDTPLLEDPAQAREDPAAVSGNALAEKLEAIQINRGPRVSNENTLEVMLIFEGVREHLHQMAPQRRINEDTNVVRGIIRYLTEFTVQIPTVCRLNHKPGKIRAFRPLRATVLVTRDLLDCILCKSSILLLRSCPDRWRNISIKRATAEEVLLPRSPYPFFFGTLATGPKMIASLAQNPASRSDAQSHPPAPATNRPLLNAVCKVANPPPPIDAPDMPPPLFPAPHHPIPLQFTRPPPPLPHYVLSANGHCPPTHHNRPPPARPSFQPHLAPIPQGALLPPPPCPAILPKSNPPLAIISGHHPSIRGPVLTLTPSTYFEVHSLHQQPALSSLPNGPPSDGSFRYYNPLPSQSVAPVVQILQLGPSSLPPQPLTALQPPTSCPPPPPVLPLYPLPLNGL